MKTKISVLAWWLSLIALGGAMDADPVSWTTVAATFAVFLALSAAIIRQQNNTA
ncbi:hypothetical protein [Alistipes sp.]|uniref:hypothetical protein n=1 Tax=Alistipes sp. TaxID=1872444 RepID=UPI003AF18D12